MRQSSRRGNLNSILVNLFEFSLSELLILTWACRHSLSFIVTLSFPCIPFGWAMWTADSSASSSIWMSDSPLRSRSSTAGQSVARLSPGTKAARNNWKISREVFFFVKFRKWRRFSVQLIWKDLPHSLLLLSESSQQADRPNILWTARSWRRTLWFWRPCPEKWIFIEHPKLFRLFCIWKIKSDILVASKS